MQLGDPFTAPASRLKLRPIFGDVNGHLVVDEQATGLHRVIECLEQLFLRPDVSSESLKCISMFLSGIVIEPCSNPGNSLQIGVRYN